MTRRYLGVPLRRDNPWRLWDQTPEPWQHRAACRGDDSNSWFTPPSWLPYRERDRLANACRWCPVIVQCLEGAIDGHDQLVTRAGIWWRSSTQAHGRDQVEPWTELWLDERRLPSDLFRTIKDEDRG